MEFYASGNTKAGLYVILPLYLKLFKTVLLELLQSFFEAFSVKQVV